MGFHLGGRAACKAVVTNRRQVDQDVSRRPARGCIAQLRGDLKVTGRILLAPRASRSELPLI